MLLLTEENFKSNTQAPKRVTHSVATSKGLVAAGPCKVAAQAPYSDASVCTQMSTNGTSSASPAQAVPVPLNEYVVERRPLV